jgi:hypothetical protein
MGVTRSRNSANWEKNFAIAQDKTPILVYTTYSKFVSF